MLLRLLLLFALLTSRSTMLNMDIISAMILKVLMSLFAESRKFEQINENTTGGDWSPHPQILLLAFDPQSASPPGNQRTGSGFGFTGYLWEPAWFRSYWFLRKGWNYMINNLITYESSIHIKCVMCHHMPYHWSILLIKSICTFSLSVHHRKTGPYDLKAALLRQRKVRFDLHGVHQRGSDRCHHWDFYPRPWTF